MKIPNLFILLLFIGLSCKNQQSNTKDDTLKSVISSSSKPNILIIFPDQLRRYSAGFWSKEPYKSKAIGKPDPVVTPNIDKLAKNGVVFTNAVSNFPLCSPYRGMLLSGMYPEQNGIWNNCKRGRDYGLKNEVQTIPDLFYEADYNTSYFGKCHWLKTEPLFDENGNYVGTTEEPGGHFVNNYDTYIPPGPPRHNIEYFYQALKDSHYNPHIYSNVPGTIEGKKDGDLHLPKVFSPKNEADKIIEYLQNKSNQRDPDKAFMMMWSLNPPHNPWDDKNTDMEILRSLYDKDKFPLIDSNLVVRKNADLDLAAYARHYYANVTSTDYYIGLVLDELKKMNALDNTIVIFSSDHGEMLGSHHKTGKNVVQTESVAIPFIVHWPKGLKSGINDLLISVPDVLPTLMGLAGIEDKIPVEVDGSNFADLIINPSQNQNEKPKAVLLMLGNSRGVMTERYTLSLQEDTKAWSEENVVRLSDAFIYDNEVDPYQLNKIKLEDKPELSKGLLKDLAVLLKKANDPWFQTKKYSDVIPYKFE